MKTLTQLTRYPRPTLGTPALARHPVTGCLAMADTALETVCTEPARRTGCKEEVGQNLLIKAQEDDTG